ncbi:4-hydroxy-3-methylbut-2-en-1-yl diphosphate reductase [Fistulifera solaris]|uniref:4-hydroxy-3-methylbut-2-enyl diphosphate reductase n=1 Tax=Fistulifera solaris TaxID=1519565 RepID=A0A1Z5JEE8_FISSO|nr:4-hydroxy-3-methylbut-2-en-1-yl diphosphate reductase [Fistulifera solaris]|eukprot:GAX12375.1 4-hydroxy-3-methylbut-2-en-1-yl diphosphate reductase [Fistulifera solaris]
MKFSSVCLALFAATSADAFRPLSASPRRAATVLQQSSSTEERALSKKEERLRMMKSPQFYRQGFKEVREGVEKSMEEQFKGEIVQQLRESNYIMERDGVKVYLAKDFGFCWGVERSIALAYEAVEHYPGKTVHITNELIHNPEVNEKLEDMNVQFIEKLDDGKKNFDTVKEGDVVILPAFGASFEEMDRFDKMNVEVVDTTCPWVSKVWNSVDKHQKAGMTSVIHGKYAHEETVATTSFCEDYICVKDMKEAEMLSNYILNGGDKEAFMKHFEKGVSKGFDPDVMLKKIGLANQTTMYKKETRAIGQLLQKTMMKKFGPAEIKNHYMEFDTICDATQERQDAVVELVDIAKADGLDFILVVGGWDSSNTAHLLEIPHHAGIRSFHIDRAECIGADNTITHRTVTGEIVTEKFIEDLSKDVVMGVTSGASTPDKAVQDSLSSIFLLKKINGENK